MEGKGQEPLMIATDLKMHFPVTRGFWRFPARSTASADPGGRWRQFGLASRGRHSVWLAKAAAGKTTLSRLIVGLQTRTGGKLQLLGMDIRNDLRDRSHDVLFQDSDGIPESAELIKPLLVRAAVASSAADQAAWPDTG